MQENVDGSSDDDSANVPDEMDESGGDVLSSRGAQAPNADTRHSLSSPGMQIKDSWR